MFVLPEEKEMTLGKLTEFVNQHRGEVTTRYKRLHDAYITDYNILHAEPKPKWKPDNRIAVNFAKYIVDTMNGFFIGVPIKITVDDSNSKIQEFVELIDQYNDQDDKNAELSKLCSIYGHGYEMYYVDDKGELAITYLSPEDAFMVYDESIIKRPRFFVRLYIDTDGVLHGSISDNKTVRYFVQKGALLWDGEEKIHGFDDVPATEYKENAERVGIFEPVLTMIDAYNKAISEKANDVDYFADAYLKVLGAKLEEDDLKHIRDDRIINFDGDTERLSVDFLQKPNGDTTQENLIGRLERLIFQISMVANISDENFGTSSGIALKYKLLAMNNLAQTKERKFTSGLTRRYKLLFGNPISPVGVDDWVKLHFQFTRNYPANISEEADIAAKLNGITSHETQLKVLSVVDDPLAEMEKMEAEEVAYRDKMMNLNMQMQSQQVEDSSEEDDDVVDGDEE